VSDSILKRFGATLATNLVGAAVSFAASLLVARTLGPKAFGDYSFLLASFAALNTWFDLGTPTAFYTFLSKGRDARAHIRFYGLWIAARLILVGAALALLPDRWLAGAWLGQPRTLVAAAWAAFFASVVGRLFLVQIAESARRTVFVQTALAVLSLSHLALVIGLRLSGALSLPALYGLLVAEYVGLGLWFALRFDPDWLGPREPGPDPAALVRRYARYCAPLAGYAVLGFAADFADRWLLQRFGGSAQQGYFALGQQFSAIALLGTTSILNIFWKELASAEAAADRARTRELYGRSSRALFFAAVAGGAFLAPHARALLTLTAGPRFADAWPTLALMLTYPSFQSLGQLNGAFFFATEDTRTHVTISSIGLLAGIPLSWLVLAPRDAVVPGLALGSAGLAARSWLTQALAVTIQSAVVSRKLKDGEGPARHWALLVGLLALGAASAMLGGAAARLLAVPRPEAAAILLSAVPYGLTLAAALRLWPGLAGADHAHIDRLLRRRKGVRDPRPPIL